MSPLFCLAELPPSWKTLRQQNPESRLTPMRYSLGGPVPRKFEIEVGGIKLESRVVSGLMNQYRLYHDQNGLRLPSDWEDQVWKALAAAYPKYVKRMPGASETRSVSIGSALNFIRFMAKRVTDKSLVAAPEAHRRAAICMSCPLRRDVSGCHICKDALQLTIHPPEAVEAPEACGACKCYMPLKVWVPREQLGSADAFPFTATCWMREPYE